MERKKEKEIGTVSFFDVVPRRGFIIRTLNPRHLQHQHDPIQHPMHNLEPCRLVTPYRRRMSHVPRLSLSRHVFENNIIDVKDLDRQRMRTVFTDGFEKAWEEGGSDDLEFQCFGVPDFDDLAAVVFTVQPIKVLLMRALERVDDRVVNKFRSARRDNQRDDGDPPS